VSSGHVDGNRSPTQNAVLEQPLSVEYNQMPPYTTKPPPYNAHPLMQSICNPPPPPPPHHQQPRPQHPPQAVQHYQVPISQTYQPPTSCPPWMNWKSCGSAAVFLVPVPWWQLSKMTKWLVGYDAVSISQKHSDVIMIQLWDINCKIGIMLSIYALLFLKKIIIIIQRSICIIIIFLM